MKIWKGKLRLNVKGKKEGQEVEAKVVIGDSGAIIFEVREPPEAPPVVTGGAIEPDGGQWRTATHDEIYAPSWLRALAETGQEVP